MQTISNKIEGRNWLVLAPQNAVSGRDLRIINDAQRRLCVMYQFKEEINHKVHFWFDKRWIENSNWKKLPLSSKAILPVIAVHKNRDGIAFPSQTTIAILSGRTEKNVRKGIKGLLGFPDLTVKAYITRRGRRSKQFVFTSRSHQGKAFPFYKDIIAGGNWSLLKSSSQALYLVIRSYGFFEPEFYRSDNPGTFEHEENFKSEFRNRQYDLCEADPKIMSEMAGISSRSFMDAFIDLKKNFLIEPIRDGFFKVFLHPKQYPDTALLNRKTAERYSSHDDQTYPAGTGETVRISDPPMENNTG